MDVSSSATAAAFENCAQSSPLPSEKNNTNTTVLNNSSFYSALDSLTDCTSTNGSVDNNSCNKTTSVNLSTDLDATLNATHFDMSNPSAHDNIINATSLLIEAESSKTKRSSSHEEVVDPKSQLANKTIFKTDNPNLSIIEISNNSIKDQDIENSVYLIECSSSEGEEDKTQKSPNKYTKSPDSSAEKRRKKAECLIQSSKQKLNIAIAEASAAESVGGVENGATAASEDSEDGQRSRPKREIKIYDTLDEFEKNLPPTVTVLDTPCGSKVYLVGTAHFSEESQDDVSYVIRNVRPDAVMVELCPSRIHILKLDEKTLLEESKNINLAKIRGIIQAHGYINGIFFILLLQISAQIAKDLGMAPGGEFRRAFDEIHKLPGCILHLGDRPIRVTLHRALGALSVWQTCKLVWRLTSSDTISIEEVEECKQRDLLEKLMQEMTGEFPAFSEVFVKERDIFLCHSLQLAALPQISDGDRPRPVRVVGVVGIGHAKGIAQLWGKVDPRTIPKIMEIPPASIGKRICKYTIKYGLIGLTLYGAFRILRPRITRFL